MINIKATNLELNKTITRYIDKKIEPVLDKFGEDKKNSCYLEVAKTTNHHKKGDIFRIEINIKLDGKAFRAVSEKEDLFSATDTAKDEIVRIIKESKSKKQTLFKRGGTSVKKMLKGLSKRNPFTSKY